MLATTFRLVSESELPEGSEYPDTGCAFSPSCFVCPFQDCILDQITAVQRRRETLTARRRAAFLASAPVAVRVQIRDSTLAEQGISRRTYYRRLQALRSEAA